MGNIEPIFRVSCITWSPATALWFSAGQGCLYATATATWNRA